jgi:hypothetical protein
LTSRELEVVSRGGRATEEAVVESLDRRQRERRDSRDLEILDRKAAALNREVEDVLSYQPDL